MALCVVAVAVVLVVVLAVLAVLAVVAVSEVLCMESGRTGTTSEDMSTVRRVAHVHKQAQVILPGGHVTRRVARSTLDLMALFSYPMSSDFK